MGNLGRKMKESATFKSACEEALTMEEVLFPSLAIDLLVKHYGRKKVDNMSPSSIAEKVNLLCLANGHEPTFVDILDAVEEYIHN